jgi:hypothetical protein
LNHGLAILTYGMADLNTGMGSLTSRLRILAARMALWGCASEQFGNYDLRDGIFEPPFENSGSSDGFLGVHL